MSYSHIVESRVARHADIEATENVSFLINIWDNISPCFIASGFQPALVYRAVDREYKDKAITTVFRRYFTSNPDLMFRIREQIKLTHYDQSLFYNKTQVNSYTTWRLSEEFEAQSTRVERGT